MRSMASSLLATVLVAAGGAVSGPPVSAAPWTSTIREPLRNSSPQARELTKYLEVDWGQVLRRLDLPGLLQTDEPFRQTGRSGRDLRGVPQAEACNAAEIRAYPTWVLPDGDRKVGVQSLEALSRWSGLN